MIKKKVIYHSQNLHIYRNVNTHIQKEQIQLVLEVERPSQEQYYRVNFQTILPYTVEEKSQVNQLVNKSISSQV